MMKPALQPQTPGIGPTAQRWAALWVSACLLGACAVTADVSGGHPATVARQLDTLLPADAVLLGEQHDAPDHQRIAQEAVKELARRGILAALVIEMADAGSTTSALQRDASEAEVQSALKWQAGGWPWPRYAPVILQAVRDGVPVVGGNLPRSKMRGVMAESEFDYLLPGPALKAQQQLIRQGHCDMLPESQIAPMTRIQIARDVSMAQALSTAAIVGKTVVLLSGHGHVNRQLGIPQHLPPELKVKAVRMGDSPKPDAASTPASFDLIWAAAPAPEKDYCADFRSQQKPKP
jgi:uncharacterized iron-regulated protein